MTPPPPPGTVLCRVDELGDPGAREFTFGREPHPFEMFVVRRGGEVFAYVNDCPHTHSPLNWMGDRFLDVTRTRIQCATHGAQFRIEDGACVSGPCPGAFLKAVPVRIDEGAVVVAGPPGYDAAKAP